MPLLNIDTDMIIPKQFLKTIKRTGLGKNLFYEMRYDEKGNPIKDFIFKKLMIIIFISRYSINLIVQVRLKDAGLHDPQLR